MKKTVFYKNKSYEVDVTLMGNTLSLTHENQTYVYQVRKKTLGLELHQNDQVRNIPIINKNKTFQAWVDGFFIEFSHEDASFASKQVSQNLDLLKSVMPGRIVKCFVKTGDIVEEGQPLLILEAMKMENEIRSPKAGTIESVEITLGATVNGGDVLVRFEKS